jgi:purine-nucleoside phosphorylase
VIDHEKDLTRAVALWDELGWPRPVMMVVSGSGLAVDLGDPREREVSLDHWLPFSPHAVEGHPLRTQLLVPREDFPVLYQKGRLHSYQGYDAHQTVFMVRLGALLGARILLMTNAAGGLDPELRPGELVQIRDHINLTGLNPLRGQLPTEWGPRFPDMGEAYDGDLRARTAAIAADIGLEIREGVYAAVAGPSYETPAEIRMLRTVGADLVGMSTVLEVIAARHLGVRCMAVSVVTNLHPLDITGATTDHAEVLAAGKAAAEKLQSLLSGLLQSLERPAD